MLSDRMVDFMVCDKHTVWFTGNTPLMDNNWHHVVLVQHSNQVSHSVLGQAYDVSQIDHAYPYRCTLVVAFSHSFL